MRFVALGLWAFAISLSDHIVSNSSQVATSGWDGAILLGVCWMC
jgi:hypothetical protein